MDGMYQRFDYFRKLLKLCTPSKAYDDKAFDGLNINFNISRPVDTNSLMNDLKTQRDMGAISTQTIIEQSPYTSNVSLELERISTEGKEEEHINEQE